MQTHHFHDRARRTLAGIVIFAMLAQPTWADTSCCCHDHYNPDLTKTPEGNYSDSACSVVGKSTEACQSSCCHRGRKTDPTALAVLPSQHDQSPHRCCRDYCQPVSAGGEESCTCEIEPSSLAILNSSRVDALPIVLVYWLDSIIDHRGPSWASDLSRAYPSPLNVKSPGRVRSVLFDRWLI